jgi:hypothetical protein
MAADLPFASAIVAAKIDDYESVPGCHIPQVKGVFP